MSKRTCGHGTTQNGCPECQAAFYRAAVPASPPATGKCPKCGGIADGSVCALGGECRVPASPRAGIPEVEALTRIGAPVASGTPKEERHISVRPDGTIRVCATDWPVSPAPAAPGVELDFEKALICDPGMGGFIYSKAELNAQVRALVDAARQEGWNEGLDYGINLKKADCKILHAPLLALVEEWQEAMKAWQANKTSCGCEECVAERRDKSDRYDRAEAALAAWRKG